MHKIKDISNFKFGKWTVLKRDEEKSTTERSMWLVKCECGFESSRPLSVLTTGKSKQCAKCYSVNRHTTGYGCIPGTYWAQIKAGAKERDIVFDISIQYAWGIFLSQNSKCAISELPIKFEKRHGSSASLDRIDSNKGYIYGNIQWVHKDINKSKSNLSDEKFIHLCDKVSKYQNDLIINANNVINVLKKNILVDGFDLVINLRKSFGSWITDARNNKKYLDFFSNFASQPLGWNHPTLISNLDKLLQVTITKVAHSDVYTTHYAEFVKELSQTMPEFEKLFLISTGTLAVENALKAAFDWKTQKLGIENDEASINNLDVIHFKNAFHGRSGYCLSLTNTDINKTKWFPKFNWTRLEINNDSLLKMESILSKNNNVAAIIIEPIQGEGGDIHVEKYFLEKLRYLSDKYECLLIFDEVQTGFGTGKAWHYQNLGVTPDLLVFGKKVQTCGFASTNRINEIKNNVFVASSRINSTWGADIVDLKRSTIILKHIRENKLLEQSKIVGDYFNLKLKELPMVSNVRGIATLHAFDMPTKEERDILLDKINKNVLCLKCGSNSIRFRPHLTFSREDVDYCVDWIKICLTNMK